MEGQPEPSPPLPPASEVVSSSLDVELPELVSLVVEPTPDDDAVEVSSSEPLLLVELDLH